MPRKLIIEALPANILIIFHPESGQNPENRSFMIEGQGLLHYPPAMPTPLPFRSLASKSGNAAVEFAIVAPLLVLLLAGIVEIGLAISTSYTLQEGLLSGANQASHKGWDSTAIHNAITSSSPRLANASITLARTCGCPSGTAITTVATCDTDPANPGTCPATCTTICTSDQLMARKYVKLTASVPRHHIFGRSFGLPATMSASMTARLP